MRSVAWTTARRHAPAYAAVLATVAFGSLLLGTCLVLLASAVAADGLDPAALADPVTAEALTGARTVFGFMTFLSVAVLVLMVSSSMAFAVTSRRRELALLRLTGASPRQIQRMAVGEAVLVGLASSALGALGSLPVAPLSLTLLRRLFGADGDELLPPELVVGHPAPRLLALLGATVVVATLATALGARAPARRSSRVAPLEAVVAAGTRSSTMTPIRWVLGLGGIVVSVALLVMPVGSDDDAVLVVLGTTFLLICALAALGPVVVPAAAGVVGGVGARWAPAALARSHARWATGRTAALGVPVLLVVGLTGSAQMLSDTGIAMSRSGLARDLHAELVLTPGDAGLTWTEVGAAMPPEVAAWVALRRSAWVDATGTAVTVVAADPAALPAVVGTGLATGAWDQIGGDTVARVAFTDDDRPTTGDRVELTRPDGGATTVTVGPVFRTDTWELLGGDLVLDRATYLAQTGDDAVDRVFVRVPDPDEVPTVAAVLRAHLPGADVSGRDEWLARWSATRAHENTTALAALFGGVALFALVGCGITVLSSARERRVELRLLRTTGAARRHLLATMVIETVVVLVTAAALLAVVLGLSYVRIGHLVAQAGSTAAVAVPVGMLAGMLGACTAVAIVAAVAGTWWSLRGGTTGTAGG